MFTTIQRAFRQGLWFSSFRFCTQIVTWSSTIIIARLLSPEDYGLMAMATIFTGYAMMFTEFGFGAAIIQRPQITQRQLSSLFWFTVIAGFVFAVGCFVVAYPTAYFFDEPRVIPLTCTVSLIFILNGFTVVPVNLLKKNLHFKQIGIIDMIASLVSIMVMILIVYRGGGVWALIGGYIMRSLLQAILFMTTQKWKPSLYFNLQDVKKYLRFGMCVVLASNFLYIFEKADQFFGAKFWSADTLGFYTFAILLARVPNDKLISLIKLISYPVFSIFQDKRDEFNSFYLNINKVIAIIVFPVSIGGFLIGEELIKVLLNEKWYPIIPLFKILCFSQIFLTISIINDSMHNSLARPSWPMYFHGTCAIFMSIAFYFAAKHGINAILIPWITLFPLICMGYIFKSLIKIKVRFYDYLKNLSIPIMATLLMAVVVFLIQEALVYFPKAYVKEWIVLTLKIALGALSYFGFLFVFDRTFLQKSYALLVRKPTKNLGKLNLL